jgi:hypothetical protein
MGRTVKEVALFEDNQAGTTCFIKRSAMISTSSNESE